jgi:predicted transcriptional regulator
MKKGEESPEDIKYLLGNMGIEILYAIEKGAKDLETIKIFSGVSMECIKGRLPVLMDLNLIEKKKRGFSLTLKGFDFKKRIEKSD